MAINAIPEKLWLRSRRRKEMDPSTVDGRSASLRRRLRDPVHCVLALVTAPVDVASLAAFRILFGSLMAFGMIRFMARGWIGELYLTPAWAFPYPGFSWVRPWPGVWMYAHFILLAIFAAGVAAGFFYRVCAILFFVGFTYVELIDQTLYLNHYYLVTLISALMIFLPANRAWSLDV